MTNEPSLYAEIADQCRAFKVEMRRRLDKNGIKMLFITLRDEEFDRLILELPAGNRPFARRHGITSILGVELHREHASGDGVANDH